MTLIHIMRPRVELAREIEKLNAGPTRPSIGLRDPKGGDVTLLESRPKALDRIRLRICTGTLGEQAPKMGIKVLRQVGHAKVDMIGAVEEKGSRSCLFPRAARMLDFRGIE